MKKWDLFISHSSEDKNEFVRPLVEKLKKAGFDVWYDEFTLKLGSSLRRSIEKGVANSEFGVVILSPNFFAKEWPQRELDSLTSLEISKRCKILPIWLNVDKDDIQKWSPLLADKIAARAEEGLDIVVQKIIETVYPNNLYSYDEIEAIIYRYFDANYHDNNFLYSHAVARLESIVGFSSEREKAEYSDEVLEDEEAFEMLHDSLMDSLRRKYRIPLLIYQNDPIDMKRYLVDDIVNKINSWVRGKLTPTESYDLFFLLDEIYDFDSIYILFGIPNFSIREDQRSRLVSEIINIGSRKSNNRGFDFDEAYKYVINKYYSSNDM